ncbi:MAG: universal stress protein [Eubacteriaceae bacterium]|nr:universal stress protein [Eubacteriaceae bacterium]
MKVLIPVDGSKYAKEAITTALSEGFLEDKEIHLITVVEGTATGRGSYLSDEVVHQILDAQAKVGNKILNEAKKLFEADRKISVAYRVGDAAEKILEYAKTNDIDLIVMGSKGKGALQSMLLGSVSIKVLQYAQCPVLIMRKKKS